MVDARNGECFLLAPASMHSVVFANWIFVLLAVMYHICSGLLVRV
jgi:hypothetical protein